VSSRSAREPARREAARHEGARREGAPGAAGRAPPPRRAAEGVRMITQIFGIATLLVLLLMAPFIGRVIRGPTMFDRLQALNGIGTLVPTVLIIVGLVYERVDMFVDLALVMFLLNLFTSLLVARYVRDKAEHGGTA
jgi:multicomponent Na+:H+ antiporter subunit F